MKNARRQACASPVFPAAPQPGGGRGKRRRTRKEALAGHLLETARAGEAPPEPSDPDAIERDPSFVIPRAFFRHPHATSFVIPAQAGTQREKSAREALLLVRAERPGKAVRLNVTLDEGLVAAIDRVASNRSGFLAEAAREHLARRSARG